MQTRYRIGVMSEVDNRQARTRERRWVWKPSTTECWRNCSQRPSSTYCRWRIYVVSKACAGKLNPGITGAAQIFVWTPTFQNDSTELRITKTRCSTPYVFCVATKISFLLLWCEACGFLQRKTNVLYDTRLQHCAAVGFLFWQARNEANKFVECTWQPTLQQNTKKTRGWQATKETKWNVAAEQPR